jgi:hypothetical protein
MPLYAYFETGSNIRIGHSEIKGVTVSWATDIIDDILPLHTSKWLR